MHAAFRHMEEVPSEIASVGLDLFEEKKKRL